MSKKSNLEKRFEMRVPEHWAENIDKWRAGAKGIPPRAEAIRHLTGIGMAIEPNLGDIMDIATSRMDSEDPNEAAKAARIRAVLKGVL